MEKPSGIVTLTTDFGLRNTYVGVVKGVLYRVFEGARIVDLTHQIPPQNIESGAWAIFDAYSFFPKGTVHMVVIDPGVGAGRRGLALYSKGHYFVGPDNGLFTPLYPAEQVVELSRTALFLDDVSSTFHARDVFAPVAAGIAKGLGLEEIGDPISDPVTIDMPVARERDGVITGTVVEVDLFGNMITNIPSRMIPDAPVLVLVDGFEVMGVANSYADLSATSPGALIGSHGRLEIAFRNGSASEYLGSDLGARVEVSFI